MPAAAPRIIVKIIVMIKPMWESFSGLVMIVTGPFGTSLGVSTFLV